MRSARIGLSKDYVISYTDQRLFGSFVEHMGATVYNGIYEPGHQFADSNGFRQDVLMLVHDLNLSAIRYPGGNFVSGFNWEDSVGPVEDRPTRLELAWQAIEPNDFGLHEFMKWLSKTDAEPILAVNLGTGDVENAQHLVEYCNFQKGSFYSDLRRRNGIENPYGIKTWCLGNETDGSWQIGAKSAEEYGRIATEAAKAMKRVDENIELVAVGSSSDRMPSFPAWDRIVLEQTYDMVDYLSLHHYIDRHVSYGETDAANKKKQETDDLKIKDYLSRPIYVERQIDSAIAACDYVKALKRSHKTMYLAVDEWNVIAEKKHEGTKHEDWQIGSPIDCGAHTMEDALVFASMMMAIIRRSDRIKIACQSLLVNTGPLIVAGKGKAFCNTIYYPFQQIARYGRGMVLQQAVSSPLYACSHFREVSILDSLSVYDPKNNFLTIFAVNRGSEPLSLKIDLHDFIDLRKVKEWAMLHQNLNESNTEQTPENVIPRQVKQTHILKSEAETTLMPYSWNVIRFSS